MKDESRPAQAAWPRIARLVTGLGMLVSALLTIQHFFAANYPTSLWEGSFCDIGAFFNCDGSAFSAVATLRGVPIGMFGALLGALVILGTVFPSSELERTNRSLLFLNALGVVALFGYSVLVLDSLCLFCAAYYVFSLAAVVVFWRRTGPDGDEGFLRRWGRPSPRVLAVLGVVAIAFGIGLAEYHRARREAQSGGAAARIVRQFFELPEVPWPSLISPYWTARGSDDFEAAPIRIVEYGDFLCSDCRYLNEQLTRLKKEFAGDLNVAFQFFPLEAECNSVVEKDKHPGACELSYLSAYDPDKFLAIHDEIFANIESARAPEWRADLARRHGVEAAPGDSATRALVQRLIQTGAEYERTSDEYSHGVRSTPTLIINNRMVIGTFPYEQLRAIFQALVDDEEAGGRRFLEHWVE